MGEAVPPGGKLKLRDDAVIGRSSNVIPSAPNSSHIPCSKKKIHVIKLIKAGIIYYGEMSFLAYNHTVKH